MIDEFCSGRAFQKAALIYQAIHFKRLTAGVAGDAERVGRSGDQLYPGYIFSVPDLVAAQTAHRDGGMDKLAFCLVFVTGNAGRGIGLRIEWHRMLYRVGRPGKNSHKGEQSNGPASKCDCAIRIGAARGHRWGNTSARSCARVRPNRQLGKVFHASCKSFKMNSLIN